MTWGEFKKIVNSLKSVDDNHDVIMATDSEGNSYNYFSAFELINNKVLMWPDGSYLDEI